MLEQLIVAISKVNIPMIYDNGLIMAIIAINMTIIGLTSLADQKCVIGVDYGGFLITKFKIAGMRMYFLIIAFALVNIISLFLMFLESPVLRLINFIFLIISLTFAIFYFFGFIIVENKWVKNQIHMSELLGLYRDGTNKKHAAIDTIVKMNPGNSTSNKISTNVVNYFDVFNGDTQKVFKKIFGPDSIIYSDKPTIVKYRKKHFKKEISQGKGYKYRVSEELNIKDISFEFFQLFRDSEMQDKWAIDILTLMNGKTDITIDENIKSYENFEILRLYNLARVIVQVDIFGYAENVFKYKFLVAMSEILFSTVYNSREKKLTKEEREHIVEVEKYMLNSLVTHFVKAVMKENDQQVISCVQDMLNDIVLDNRYKGSLLCEEVVGIFVDVATKQNCKELQEIVEVSLTLYESKKDKETEIDIKKLVARAEAAQERTGNEKKIEIWV